MENENGWSRINGFIIMEDCKYKEPVLDLKIGTIFESVLKVKSTWKLDLMLDKIKRYEIIGHYYKIDRYYYNNEREDSSRKDIIDESKRTFQILLTISDPLKGARYGGEVEPQITRVVEDIDEKTIKSWFRNEARLLPEFRTLKIIQ